MELYNYYIPIMKLRHYDGDGRAHFVTFGTFKKFPLITNNENRKTIIDAIISMREKYGFRLLGYVLMPEHIHLVIVPADGTKLGRIIGEIKRESAVKILDKFKRLNSPILSKLEVTRNGIKKHAFWQRRCYDHNCRTPESVWKAIDYCHNNPMKRGLVNKPSSWIWSSYRFYHGKNGVVLKIDSAT